MISICIRTITVFFCFVLRSILRKWILRKYLFKKNSFREFRNFHMEIKAAAYHCEKYEDPLPFSGFKNFKKFNCETQIIVEGAWKRLLCFNRLINRDGHGTGLPASTIFVPGTWVPKPKIPGLSQRFFSKSQESQGFVSYWTTLEQPKFLGLLMARVSGFGCARDFCPGTVPAIFFAVPSVPRESVSIPGPSPGIFFPGSESMTTFLILSGNFTSTHLRND